MPGPLARRLVLTGSAAWLAVRLALGLLGYAQVSYMGMLGVATVTLVIAWLDLRRNDELLLYGNLGISPMRMSVVVVSVALALELVVGVPVSGLLLEQAALTPAP